MAEDLQRNINTKRVEILKNLDLEVIIIEELRSKYIISQEQAETLLDETVPYRRNSLFIRYLERKSPSQIEEFCGVLQNYGQKHVSQIITESVPTTNVSDDTSDEIFRNFVKNYMYAHQEQDMPDETTDDHTKEKHTSERLKNLGDETDPESQENIFARVGRLLRKIADEFNASYEYKRSMETDPHRMSDLDLIILAGLVAAKVITEEQAAVVAEHKKLNLFKCSFAYISEEEKSNFMNKLQKTLLLQDNEKQDGTHKCPDTEKVDQQDWNTSYTQDDIKHYNSMKQAREIVKEDIIEQEATITDTQQKPVSSLMKNIDLNALCATVLTRAKRVVMHGPRDSESVLSALAAEWASITEDIVVLDNPLQQEMKVSEYLKKFDLTVTLDIENNHNNSLSEIILQDHPRLRNVENVMSLIKKNQSKVLFLIKGYDKSKLDENSDIQKLLNREILPDATCIVSTTDQFPGYKTSWSDKEVLVEDYLHNKHTIPDEENHPVWMKPKKSSTEYIQNCCIEDIQESRKNRASSLKQSQQTMKLYEVCFSGTPSRILTVDPVQTPAKALFIDTVAVDWALYWKFMKQGKPMENMLDKAAEHLLSYDICMTLDLHDVTSHQTLVDIIKSQHPKFEELDDLPEFLEENQNKTLFLVKGFKSYMTKGMYNSDINKLFEKSLLPDAVCVLAYRGQVRRSDIHWGRCVQLTEDQVDVCRSNGKGKKRRLYGPVCAVELDAKKPRN